MAARTGVGIGMGITVAILGVASLGLFILSIVFLSKYQASQKSLQDANAALQDFVSADERQRDDIRSVVESARSGSPRRSAVAYLQSNLEESMKRLTGSPRDTIERIDERRRTAGIEGVPLFQALGDRAAEISRLNAQLTQADNERKTALANLNNEVQRRAQMEQSQRATLAALTQQADNYKSEVDELRARVDELSAIMDERVEKNRVQFEDTITGLRTQLNDANTQVQILQGQLDECRRSARGQTLRPGDEHALVDGEIIAVNSVANTVTINRGKKDKVPLGLLFAVYNNAAAITPDASGAYPRGKATLEVISVGEGSAQARIVPGSEIKGNPVVKGDVVANALYDPKKTYKFVVFGNFDADNDRVSTPGERNAIVSMIQDWGGEVIDNLAGNVDFLVLGERPVLPPKPGPEAPVEIIQQYMRLNSIVGEYDRFVQQAQATSVPILNQHRLFTLIGR